MKYFSMDCLLAPSVKIIALKNLTSRLVIDSSVWKPKCLKRFTARTVRQIVAKRRERWKLHDWRASLLVYVTWPFFSITDRCILLIDRVIENKGHAMRHRLASRTKRALLFILMLIILWCSGGGYLLLLCGCLSKLCSCCWATFNVYKCETLIEYTFTIRSVCSIYKHWVRSSPAQYGKQAAFHWKMCPLQQPEKTVWPTAFIKVSLVHVFSTSA